MNTLESRIVQAFDLTLDLFLHFSESTLRLDLPGLPSNRISAQAWCIVGGRESYLKAIKQCSWQGFSCSLNEPTQKDSILLCLNQTKNSLKEIDFLTLNPQQTELAFSLLEHEIQHHGQLIRYVYANGLTFPVSWNKRYTV